MRKAPSVAALALWLVASSAPADEPLADCLALQKVLAAPAAYDPPGGSMTEREGWCVLDRATLRSLQPGWPDLSAEQVRLRQGGDANASWVEMALIGLRAAPRPADGALDDRLRAAIRLQSAEVWLMAVHDIASDSLELRITDLRLSGGTSLTLAVALKGASLDPGSLAGAALTRLDLDWRTDGRLPRPLMDLAGGRMTGQEGPAAVDAARAGLARLVAGLPPSVLGEAARGELERAIAALPQGRGRLQLTLDVPSGIGAARVAAAALAADPLGEAALARLTAGASLSADWQPGLAP